MRLFDNIPPSADDNTLCKAIAAILKPLTSLPTPRSLCEIRADEDDYEWLCTWANQVDHDTLRRWLRPLTSMPVPNTPIPITRFVGLGCLLLLFHAEAARREAHEGGVWSYVSGRFRNAGRLLFVQGQPTLEHKEAMEAATLQLKLRHAFGIEGAQSYYLSVYLQFGFTSNGISRLPFWLAGQGQTESIKYLLGDGTLDLSSPQFRELWCLLRDYRRHLTNEQAIREKFKGNPWVLPTWIDELLRCACERMELDSKADEDILLQGDEPIAFLEPPRLLWRYPAEPRFSSKLINLEEQGLSKPHYNIIVNGNFGNTVGRIIRKDDGSYSSCDLSLPCDNAQSLITLVDPNGCPDVSAQIELWNPSEDVTVFELPSGQRMDAWKDCMSTKRSYALLVADDLTVTGSLETWQQIGNQTKWRLHLLQPEWDSCLQIALNGALLWEPNLDEQRRAATPEPEWAESVEIHCVTIGDHSRSRDTSGIIHLGQPVQPRIRGLSAETALSFVRLGTIDCTIDSRDGSRANISPIVLDHDAAASRLVFTIGLCHGNETARIQRSPNPPVEIAGAARFGEDGWTVFKRDTTLTVREAEESLFKLFLADSWTKDVPEHLALMEGNTFSRRLWRAPRRLNLIGLGARLEVRDGPYNSTRTLLTLADKVIDLGIIRSLDYLDDGNVRVHLWRSLEPGSRHQIVCWSLGRRPRILPATRIVSLDKTTWLVKCDALDPSHSFIGVAYEGEWLGAWWPVNLDCVLPRDNTYNQDDLETTAALLRWMKAPILSRGYRDTISAFARQYPSETLAAWLLDDSLPDGLRFGAATTSDHWLTAVRRVFENWRPTPDEAKAIIDDLSRDDPDALKNPLPLSISRLRRLDPLLMGRVLLAWHQSNKARPPSIWTREQLRALTRLVADLPRDATDKEVAQRLATLRAQTAQDLNKVDPGFLDGIVGFALSTLNRLSINSTSAGNLNIIVNTGNLNTALGVSSFRQYLALHVLREIADYL